MNFNDLKNGGNVLSVAQMKNVKGGGTCGFRMKGQPYADCNLSKETAKMYADAVGGYWCCDSCNSNGGKASYC